VLHWKETGLPIVDDFGYNYTGCLIIDTSCHGWQFDGLDSESNQ